MLDKLKAYSFLVDLGERLNNQLFGPEIMRAEVCRRWDKPKADKTPQEQVACPENIFLYHFALPEIAHHMMSIDGFNEEKVRQSLRGEYYKKFERLCSANTRRRQGHPFEKKYPFEKELQVSVSRIMQGWRTPRKVFAANESYPDLAILEPFPFTVVFDAKFFKDESPTSAERALVTGVYELVFYRGLPPASDDAKGYDFGCLLAYDASDGAFLQQAWESVASKRLFWEGAHVFVMIVRGKSPSALTGPIPSIPAE